MSANLSVDPAMKPFFEALGKLYPTADAAVARAAYLQAVLELPKGTIHIVSDVHGESKKLQHVLRNASGSLRVLVEQTFGDRLGAAEKLEFLNLIYYPREMFEHLAPNMTTVESRRGFLQRHVRHASELLRVIARRYSLKALDAAFPEDYRLVLREILFERDLTRSSAYINAMLDRLLTHGHELHFLRILSRVIRNLLVREVIVAGDLGDRGPRLDQVIETLRQQPRVAITWGNHDAVWMGAALGENSCIATVMRNSLRYRRLSQLEEGYGIPFAPIEKLARTVYGEDPATRFACKGEGLRDSLLMARMQKAVAIIQFKLEGQLAARNPHFNLGHRTLLGNIDIARGVVRIDGTEYPLLDTARPTVDWAKPFELSAEETAALARMRQSFVGSPVLWEHMQFLANRGAMHLIRDRHLIFHGCVPVDDNGEFLAMEVDGQQLRGRALFEALDKVWQRALRKREPRDLDLIYYLWTGELSPLFGKDRMTTFEGYFVADKATHKETKNAYFKLIHDKAFCARVLREFGVDETHGLIVNGHVPVKLEAGESPVKKSGMAITIDGAFSEAYGDKGYTLVLDATRTWVAQHHHFDSVKGAITDGADIIPTIEDVRVFDQTRTVGDTEEGEGIRRELAMLEQLLAAYQDNVIAEHPGALESRGS